MSGGITFVRYQPRGSAPKRAKFSGYEHISTDAMKCRPFLEAGSLGFLLYPPFDAEVRHRHGSEFEVKTDQPLEESLWREVAREVHGSPTSWWCSKIAEVFQIDVGLMMVTPAGVNSLIIPPANVPSAAYWTHSGLVETDRFHVPFTINLQMRVTGSVFQLCRAQPIAQVVTIERAAMSQDCLIEEIGDHPDLIAEWIAYRGFAFDVAGDGETSLKRRRAGSYSAWLREHNGAND